MASRLGLEKARCWAKIEIGVSGIVHFGQRRGMDSSFGENN